jgi:hypothetical protein
VSLTPYERETVINMNDADSTAIINTYQRSLITKLRKNPSVRQTAAWKIDGTEGAAFELPAKLLSIRSGTRKRAPMTDEQKQAAGERMRNARAAKS